MSKVMQKSWHRRPFDTRFQFNISSGMRLSIIKIMRPSCLCDWSSYTGQTISLYWDLYFHSNFMTFIENILLAETRFFFSNVPIHQSNFKVTQVKKSGQIWCLGGFSGEHMKKNGLKFGILAYPDHFQNWLDFVTLLWFFQILSLWNRTDLGFPGVFVKRMEGVAWSLAYWGIPTNYRTD